MPWLLERRSPSTVNHARRAIRALWSFARRKKLLRTESMVEKLKEPKREAEAWSLEEYNRIIRVAAIIPGNVDGHLACRWWPALLLLAYDTGLRIGAIMALEWRDLETRWLYVRAEVQKQLADQRFGLHPDTITALKRIRPAEPDDDTPIFAWPWCRGTLHRKFAEILELAQVL
jgi:integrase